MTPAEPPDHIYAAQPDYRILEGLEDAILVVDEDVGTIWTNTACRRMLGVSGSEPGRIADALGVMSEVADGDRIPEFDCRFPHPGGERRYRCSASRAPSGRGWVIRLREVPGGEDYEAIVEYTGTATILIEGDGTISVANTEFERLSGYPRAEIVGKKRLTDFVASEDERRRLKEYHTLRRKDPAAAPKNYSFTFIDRSGNLHAVEATIGLIPGTTRSVMSLVDVTERRRAERALQESEERLNLALSAANDGLNDWDVGAGTVFCSPRGYTMLGYEPRASLLTLPAVLSLVHPEDRGRVEAVLAGMASGERDRCETEFRMRSASGEWVYVLDRLRVVCRDGDGTPLRIAGTQSDITERKRAERELLIRGMAIESSFAAFTIADLDGRLTYVNQAFLSMWGYDSPTEVIGRPATELWQDEEEALETVRELIRTGRCTGERIGRRQNGTLFYAMFSGNLVTGGDGAPICLAASFTDITNQKQAEAKIQAHNRKLWVLNRIIGAATSATDIDEALERVLAATLALLDLSGGGIYLIEPGKQRARLVCVQSLLEGFPPQPCIPDITAQPYAGVLVAGTPLFLDDHAPGESEGTLHPYASIPIMAHGKVIGALNVVSGEGSRFTAADRSLLTAIGREVGTSVERSMLIRQLETAEREANLYLDILSHDIRNAENVSGLYADLLVDMLEGEARGYAEKLRSSLRKSVEILRNVSTIRRIHHESTVLAPIDLNRVIRDEIAIFSGSRIRYDGTDLAVMADPLLPEVLTNLIGNAVKFGGPAVEVTVRVEESGDEVRISVEDTGPGVPDGMKDAVFMRFGQNKSRKSGQGLGLYITRMLILRYDGRIRVDDRVPGRPECGAAFRFWLKRAN